MRVKGCNTIVKPLKINRYASVLIACGFGKNINFEA